MLGGVFWRGRVLMPLLRRAAIISRPAQNNPTTNPTKTQKTTTHKKKVVDSENLMTLFVVVNKFGVKDWEGSYETLCDFIVPRSSRRVAEDNDYALMGVVLFRRVADVFKAAARARGFQVMRACLCGCGRGYESQGERDSSPQHPNQSDGAAFGGARWAKPDACK